MTIEKPIRTWRAMISYKAFWKDVVWNWVVVKTAKTHHTYGPVVMVQVGKILSLQTRDVVFKTFE